MNSAPPSYQRHRRYPVGDVSHCVWLYFHLPLSFREVQELTDEAHRTSGASGKP